VNVKDDVATMYVTPIDTVWAAVVRVRVAVWVPGTRLVVFTADADRYRRRAAGRALSIRRPCAVADRSAKAQAHALLMTGPVLASREEFRYSPREGQLCRRPGRIGSLTT